MCLNTPSRVIESLSFPLLPDIVGIMDGDKIHMSYMLENADQILVDTDTGC